ncbi:MAG TPA: hypothetical protein V6C88_08175 [Chroococcidiopsis sp.]
MKSETLSTSSQTMPDRLQEAIRNRFPGTAMEDLTIRYYDSVEDVGYEYFTETVLSACEDNQALQRLAPFISYVQLGESLVLEQKEGLVVYDSNGDDRFTEVGPFWLVTPKAA